MRALVSALLVAAVVLVGGAMRIETIQQERSVQSQLAKLCPQFWAKGDLLKDKPEYQTARTWCPEA